MRIALCGLVLFWTLSASAEQWEIIEERLDDSFVRMCCQVDSYEINVRQVTGAGLGRHCTSCGAAPAMCAVSAYCTEIGDSSTQCPPANHDSDELLPMDKYAFCGRNVCRVAETTPNKTLFQRCFSEMREQNLQIPDLRDMEVRLPGGAGVAQ